MKFLLLIAISCVICFKIVSSDSANSERELLDSTATSSKIKKVKDRGSLGHTNYVVGTKGYNPAMYDPKGCPKDPMKKLHGPAKLLDMRGKMAKERFKLGAKMSKERAKHGKYMNAASKEEDDVSADFYGAGLSGFGGGYGGGYGGYGGYGGLGGGYGGLGGFGYGGYGGYGGVFLRAVRYAQCFAPCFLPSFSFLRR
jgi:hypothetical protein